MGSGCGCGCGTDFVQGAGPDQGQTRRARAQMPASFLTDPVGQDPHRPTRRDARGYLPPLHQFRERVNIVTATALQETVANDSGVVALPGRFPTTGWDGEPGASSPVADRGGY